MKSPHLQRRLRQRSADGFPRDDEAEDRLNLLALRLFTSPDGEEFLKYLNDITVRRRLPPGTQPETMLHLEGQRWIVGIIESRLSRGAGAKDINPQPEVPDIHEPETDQS